jgi:hypothetical protein
MLDPGGGNAIYWPGGVCGGEGSCEAIITGIEAGSFAAIPKSVSFQVFVFAEYKTKVLALRLREGTYYSEV